MTFLSSLRSGSRPGETGVDPGSKELRAVSRSGDIATDAASSSRPAAAAIGAAGNRRPGGGDRENTGGGDQQKRDQEHGPTRNGQDTGREPAMAHEPERGVGHGKENISGKMRKRGRQQEVACRREGHAEHEKTSRQRRLDRPHQCRGGEEEDREQVTVPQRPAAVPVLVPGQQQEETGDRDESEDAVRPVLLRPPPRQEPGNEPEPEGGPQENPAGALHEEVPRDLKARRAEAEEPLVGEMSVVRARFTRGGEDPG